MPMRTGGNIPHGCAEKPTHGDKTRFKEKNHIESIASFWVASNFFQEPL
jgi:hypothetical protein